MYSGAGSTITVFVGNKVLDLYSYLYINQLFGNGSAGGINIGINKKFVGAERYTGSFVGNSLETL